MAKEIKRPVMKKVLENSAWGFLASLITRGGALVFAILLARFLLPEKYGLYSLALSIALFFMTLSTLGIDQSFIRYIADALGKKDKKKATAYYKYLLKIKVSLVLGASLLLLVLSYPLSVFVFKKIELFIPIALFSVYLIILSIEGFYSSIFTALKKNHYQTIRETLSQITRIVLVTLLFLSLSPYFYVIGVISVLIITAILMLIYTLYFSKKIAPFLFETTEKEIDKRRVNKFLKAVILLAITGIFFTYVDSIMLGIFIPKTEFLGFYRAAYTLVFSVAGLISFSPILMPFFTQFKKHTLNEAFSKALRYASILTIPATFGIVILGRFFIRLIYGQEYSPATLPLYFLALLIFNESFSSMFGSLFSAREKPQDMAKVFITSSILNVVLNIILISLLARISLLWAVAGAAIATLLSRYFYLFVMIFLAKRKLDIKPNFSFLIKPFFASFIMALIILGILQLISDMTILLGSLLVILGILIYFFVLFIIKGIQKQDIDLIREFIKSRKS